MGWSAGYTVDMNEKTQLGVDTPLGDFAKFTDAIRALHAYATLLDEHVEECETLIADIDDIRKDPGIMDDPDQWEDMDFPTDRENNLTFWVVEY